MHLLTQPLQKLHHCNPAAPYIFHVTIHYQVRPVFEDYIHYLVVVMKRCSQELWGKILNIPHFILLIKIKLSQIRYENQHHQKSLQQ